MGVKARVIVGGLVVVLLAAFALYLAGRSGPKRPFGLPPKLGCEVTSPAGSVSLDLTQMANAATVTAVGQSRKVPARGVVVALATALQESKLENLSGGDRDSLGLFQQRPSQGWGTAEQISDPRYAAKKFYTALVKVKGWQAMRVTEAAQKVQRSAYPNAYEKWADEAQTIADALLGHAPAAVVCTVPEASSSPVGGPAVSALAESMRLDYGTSFVLQVDDQAKAVRVPATAATQGWAYAHWLVSRAADHGVARVAFAGREWTAQTGSWNDLPSADPTQVVASVA
ncbi:hypothetical protein [Hamadaea tsunoensis]|uniref:hypothetical protein n=1 Tax=Hamadaea tsunoensis TaxID=53368 RepID=UPI0004842ADA|nr:hypothetical protein [Hamadaea tsunoensis]